MIEIGTKKLVLRTRCQLHILTKTMEEFEAARGSSGIFMFKLLWLQSVFCSTAVAMNTQY